jgi:replicative superfamily II helicase
MSETCIPTSTVPHLLYPFKEFNPAQSMVVPWRNQDVNLICASPTSSGKTVMAELVMDDALARGKKTIYAAPMKAIAQEKKKEWMRPGNGFGKYKVFEVTSDQPMTDELQKELQTADIIVMTTEALDARCRRMETEKNEWLFDVGALIVDEVHLLCYEERGDRLESSLMRFSQYNPDARLCFLSGTVANYEEIGQWAESLNGKKTVAVHSDYRPCPLRKQYIEYEDGKERFTRLTAILKEYPDDLFIVFVSTKPEGRSLEKMLTKMKYKVAFHNADRNMENREKIENDFKHGKLDVLIATSTLAYGVNLPARRVVVYGVTRGPSDVHAIDIHQECGRAGRKGLDEKGDAYIFIKEDNFWRHRERIEAPAYVESQMSRPKVMAFHLVSEIERKNVKTSADIQRWFRRSLSSFQGTSLGLDKVHETVEMLIRVGAIRKAPGGEYECTSTGRVAAWFYHSPFDIAAWRENFTGVFRNGENPDDFDLAWATVATDTTINRGYPPTKEFAEIGAVYQDMCADRGYTFHPHAVQKAAIVHQYLSGADLEESSQSRIYEFKRDVPRLVGTLKTLGEMSGLYKPSDAFWDTFEIRLSSGVSREMLPLVEMDGVGRVRAKKLFEAGIRSYEDVAGERLTVEKILGAGTGYKVYQSAMKILKGRLKDSGP